MDKTIIVNMRFNTFMSTHPEVPRLSKEWIDYRLDIFMRFTCKSLLNQSNQNFIGIVHYDELSHDLIQEGLSNHPKLPDNVIFTTNPNKVINKIARTCDYLYIARIDCDDIYHPTFIQQLIDFPFYEGLQCIINQEGYIYDYVNDKLGVWYHFSPPFYTLIYKSEDYLAKKFYKLSQGHKAVINLNHAIINKRNFVVTAHANNTSTAFDKSHTKEVITDKSIKSSILKEFNIVDKNK
ncbi:glycosyltransferase [Romboutsia lituseburensis]|uniref:Glycosyltransferase 2-like domain-containing protein n=1 Tax=Romboutsia lituseburensis DSM 797 TaxID=1121325 RepID=A0A1G9KCQ8_9FIRM|nr:glycosyltransferase [Romboutsia lituseburensis]CEH34850.1 Tetratricopeptide repeat [Romboutsia lituseburensis]SDL47224.1 hypothetical protein SAMN04515677_10287 [Romboutsia lituseburensis DSM 797]